MRIAYVCADPGVPVFGRKGSSVHVQEVVRALDARGAEVELFVARTGGDAPAGLEDVPLHVLPEPTARDFAEREHDALKANGPLCAALEAAGPFDLVYERYSLWSFAGMDYACEHGIPGLLEVNAPLIEEQVEHRGLVDRDRAERVARLAFGKASAILAVSDQVAAYVRTFPEAVGRVHVIPNGVDPGRFPALPAHTNKDTYTVGFVGTLKPWHGLPCLAEAFDILHAHAPESRLLIVGDGPERESLEAQLAAQGLSDVVRFTGAVAPEDVPQLLAEMDAAVAPYPPLKRFYFSPLKVYEYMGAGLPVVAAGIGQLQEIIRHDVNGLLYAPGDVQALAAALDRLLGDAGLRARLGVEAREHMLKHHTWSAVVERILGIADACRYELRVTDPLPQAGPVSNIRKRLGNAT